MKPAIQLGVVTGVASSLWMYLKYALDNPSLGGINPSMPFLILFTGIGVGIFLHKKSNEFGPGILPFKEGAKTGVLISVIAGFILAGYAMLHFLVVHPEYLQEASESLRTTMEEANKTASEIEKEIANLQSTRSVGKLMFGSFTITLIIGMVASFLIAAVLKKEPSA